MSDADITALVAMLRHIQCEPASFDTYSMASAAERAADAIERLRSSGGARTKHSENCETELLKGDPMAQCNCGGFAAVRVHDEHCPTRRTPEPCAEPVKGSKAWHEIQGLRGYNARLRIGMDIIDRLLDGTADDDLTSIDMEYWIPVHDRIRALVRKSSPEPAAERTCEWSQTYDWSGQYNTCKEGEEWHLPDGLELFPYCHYCGGKIVIVDHADSPETKEA